MPNKEAATSNSKITEKQVIAARKLKASKPDMTVQAIKDKLELDISIMALGRTLRGIYHSDVDMCGLPVRPFEHNEQITKRLDRKEKRKAERAEKAAAKKAAKAAKKESVAKDAARKPKAKSPKAQAESDAFVEYVSENLGKEYEAVDGELVLTKSAEPDLGKNGSIHFTGASYVFADEIGNEDPTDAEIAESNEPQVGELSYTVAKDSKGVHFTSVQIAEIKRRAESGMKRMAIADLFGVSLSSVARALAGKFDAK